MQYNVFFVELLGDEDLSGVLIPVVMDTKNSLSDSKMASVARVFNNYRTVFVKGEKDNTLKTAVYSIGSKVTDCLYANAATVFALTRQAYIRDIKEDGKDFTIDTGDCFNKVNISLGGDDTYTMAHQIGQKKHKATRLKEDSHMEILRLDIKDGPSTLVIEAKDSTVFSKVRREKSYYTRDDLDYVCMYVDESIDTVFFHVHRSPGTPAKDRIDSRIHIGLIIQYLLDQKASADKLKKVCHVLNSGQYAIIDIDIKDDTIYTYVNSRIMVEGIVNI